MLRKLWPKLSNLCGRFFRFLKKILIDPIRNALSRLLQRIITVIVSKFD